MQEWFISWVVQRGGIETKGWNVFPAPSELTGTQVATRYLSEAAERLNAPQDDFTVVAFNRL